MNLGHRCFRSFIVKAKKMIPDIDDLYVREREQIEARFRVLHSKVLYGFWYKNGSSHMF